MSTMPHHWPPQAASHGSPSRFLNAFRADIIIIYVSQLATAIPRQTYHFQPRVVIELSYKVNRDASSRLELDSTAARRLARHYAGVASMATATADIASLRLSLGAHSASIFSSIARAASSPPFSPPTAMAVAISRRSQGRHFALSRQIQRDSPLSQIAFQRAAYSPHSRIPVHTDVVCP